MKPAPDGAHAAAPAFGRTRIGRTTRRESDRVGDAFWRLLADYESTSRDETTAIRGQDFETVAEVQTLKSLLFAALEDCARDLGIDRRDASFHERLEKIAVGERANQAFVKQLLARNAAERRTLDTARSRLRGLLHSYVALKAPCGGSFFARG